MNRLLTPQLIETFKKYPLYSQEGKRKNAVCIAVFFIGNIKWYVLEGQPERDDFTIFSIVVGFQETEYGYASLKEMESIEIDTGIKIYPKAKIMQDISFKPCLIKDIQDKRVREFLNSLYRK